MGVIGILREAGRYGSRGTCAADDLAGVVDGLTPGITRLDARTAVTHGAEERSLQSVISGVGVCHDHVFYAEAADHVAGAIELSLRCEGRTCAGIGVGKAVARELFCGSAHITGVGGEVADFALQADRPGEQGAIAEPAVDAA